jgi:hypothetical protein
MIMLEIISILKKIEVTFKKRSRQGEVKVMKAAFWSVYAEDEIIDMEIQQLIFV